MNSTTTFRILTFIAFLMVVQFLAPSSATAQYNPFPYRHYQFDYSGGDSLYVIRVDKITHSGNVEIYYFNPVGKAEASDSDQITADSNNVFGQKMIRSVEGNLVFVTTTADTFKLFPASKVHEPWIFHNKTGLTAEISERTTESFLGKSDSVIVFRISNGQEIRLSKNFGFVKAFSFGNKIQGKEHALSLSAIADIRMGKFIFHDSSLRDYQKGDQFIMLKDVGPGYEHHLELNIIGSRTDYTDSTLYLLEVFDALQPKVMVSRKIKVLHSPFAFINSDSSYAPSFGISPPLNSLTSDIPYRVYVNLGIGKKEGEKYYSINQKGTRVYSEILKEGYGMLAERYYADHEFYRNDMLCFNGQGKSFGNCDSSLAVIMGTAGPGELKVMAGPNPASEVINVYELKKPVGFKLCDLNGKILAEGELSPSDSTINIRNLNSGFYLLQLFDQDKIQIMSFTRN